MLHLRKRDLEHYTTAEVAYRLEWVKNWIEARSARSEGLDDG